MLRHLPWLACLAACNPNNLPPDARAPRLGDRTDAVAPIVNPGQWYTHPTRSELLLASYSEGATGWQWAIFDAEQGTRDVVCAGGPYNLDTAGWLPQVGRWAWVEGTLAVHDADGDVLSACVDGSWSPVVDALPLDPGAIALGETSWLGLSPARDRVLRLDPLTGQTTEVAAVGEVVAVSERREDATALWWVEQDRAGDRLILNEMGVADTAPTLLLEVPLGGQALGSVLTVHPDGLLYQAGDFTFGAARQAATPVPIGAVDALPPDVTMVPYPDGSGIVLVPSQTSVYWPTERVYTGATVAHGGWHYLFEGDDWERTQVTVWANNADGAPDAPHTTFELDLSHSTDWLGNEDVFGNPESVFRVRGFDSGLCVVGRDYIDLALWFEARPEPTEEGDYAWQTTADRFYAGPCGQAPKTEVSSGVTMYFGLVSLGVPSHSVPIAFAQLGVYNGGGTYEGGNSGSFEGRGSGWHLDERGQATPLYHLSEKTLRPMRGERFWTVQEGELRSGTLP